MDDKRYSLVTVTPDPDGDEETKTWFRRGVFEHMAVEWGSYYVEDNPDAIVMVIEKEHFDNV